MYGSKNPPGRTPAERLQTIDFCKRSSQTGGISSLEALEVLSAKKAASKQVSSYLSSHRIRAKVAKAERLWKAPLARLAQATAVS